jgi:hypothetical protein
MNWYACKSAGAVQGLVIEEGTGRNVAVAYDEKDTALLAAAPRLKAALKALVEGPGLCGKEEWRKKCLKTAMREAEDAIRESEGK